METTYYIGLYWGSMGVILGIYWGYIGKMEKKMETTTWTPKVCKIIALSPSNSQNCNYSTYFWGPGRVEGAGDLGFRVLRVSGF